MSLRVIWGICLKKPVIVGPNDSTIESPTREAIAAGLCEELGFPGLQSGDIKVNKDRNLTNFLQQRR